jgi:hypothetical protein
VLSKAKIIAAYGLAIPSWEESLSVFLGDIAAGEKRKMNP